jgi:ribonuclease Z
LISGDTTFDVFLNPPNPDLLKVKLLITETTFVDDDIDRYGRSSVAKAEAVGHIHLRQICEHPHLFDNVDSILLVHFSDKYTVQYIRDRVHELVPESLRNKIYLGLTAQELYLGLGVQEDV